jgi:hypothetical protein
MLISVPDHGRSSISKPIQMYVYLALGNPRGSGFTWSEGYMSKRRELGSSVYQQPGTRVDRTPSQQGGFPSK